MHALLLDRFKDSGHFAGVPEALHARGASFEHWRNEPAPPPAVGAADALALWECLSPRATRTLRLARAGGVPALLLMDGLCEWRNTHRNPQAGPAFLRPAPVDAIACAGPIDEAILRALGNTAVATGLPRLARTPVAPAPGTARILVATARRAFFDDDERERLLRALTALRDAARRAQVEVVWRVTCGLHEDLAVPRDTRPLPESLARCAGVVTTPSTLLVEAMLAGRPTAILHPHPTPLWQPAAWIVRDDPDHDDDWPRSLPNAPPPPAARFTTRAFADLFDSLLTPDADRLAAQRACLRLLHTDTGEPAGNIAAALFDLAQRTPAGAALPPPIARACARRPRAEASLRVVRMVVREAGERADPEPALQDACDALGAELRTLVVAASPPGAHDHGVAIDPRLDADVCVLDPAHDPTEALRLARLSVERVEPTVLIIDTDGFALAIGAQVRTIGVRVVVRAADAGEAVLLGRSGAWDACAALGADARAADWRELLVHAAHRTIHARATDAGLRLDGQRWLDWGHPDDAARADAWAEARLHEAGCTHIALARPTRACDAVLVRCHDAPPTGEQVRRWRAAGRAVALPPACVRDDDAARICRAIRAAHRAGCQRVALYGVGLNAHRAAARLTRANLVGYLDDRARPGQRFLGLPVVTPEGAGAIDPDAVVLSSAAHERAMLRRCAPLADRGVLVLRFTGRRSPVPAGAAC